MDAGLFDSHNRFPFIFCSPDFPTPKVENLPMSGRISGALGSLVDCMNEPSVTVNPAGRGSGGALGEAPNGLSASRSLPDAERQCQS
jgi:hypothetical protein